MAFLKARLNSNGEIRLVELERRSPSFQVLEAGARRKYKISNAPQFAFLMGNGQRIAIRSTDDLKVAIAETLKVQGKFVELEVLGAGSKAPAPAPAPAAAPAPAPAPAPAQVPRQPAPAAAPTSPGAVLTVAIPASGGAEKVKIGAQQESDCYKFVPTPSREPTTIDVELPSSRALVFRINSASAKLTQTFNMPFDVTPADLSLEGTTVVLKFPW